MTYFVEVVHKGLNGQVEIGRWSITAKWPLPKGEKDVSTKLKSKLQEYIQGIDLAPGDILYINEK